MALGTRFEPTLLAGQAGADWALAALYRDVQPGLLGYLFAQEPREAEDLASEVWLDVARGLTRFEGKESAFRCWVFTIARRRLIDLRRMRARRATNPVPPERLLDNPDPSDPFLEVEGRAALAWLQALPPEQGEILLLRVVAGLDSNETALVTGRKAATVRVMQKRALERLARLLAAERERGVTR